jgi:hypothetical protein
VLVKPVLRKVSHGRMLRALGTPGAEVVRRWVRFDGLHVKGEGWEADVVFKPSFEKGGHVHFKADLKRPTPDVVFPAAEGGAAALAAEGDGPFAEKLLTDEVRMRLLRLGALGGRLWYVRDGAMEIVGPLGMDPPALRAFLGLCREVADLAAAALSTGREDR